MTSRLAIPDPEVVKRFDRPGPRYTSYPTAVEFHDGVGEREYRERLAQADSAHAGEPLSLYIHIPFCAKHCSYCGCHVIATPRRDIAAGYLDYLGRELELLAGLIPERRRLIQMHWGGGTPTYLEPAQLEQLFALVTRHFEFIPDAERAIEVDPRVTSTEHLAALARLGFNRLSFGVQDFTPTVQEAIGRGQTFEQTKTLMESARRLGFADGINFDLVYGLPLQTEASFRQSLDLVTELRPDRLAIYSFAFVPWIRPNQKKIVEAALPHREAKMALYFAALEKLLDAGYEPIGMDHFALPDDELARAARAGRLDRNFMGYTVKPSNAMLACGVSGIGEVGGGFFANEKKLSRYYEALDAGRLPIERGYLLDDDDRIRQYVIRQLMCNFLVSKSEVATRFGIDFDTYFASSLDALDEVRAEGFVRVAEDALTVTPQGRLFVRNVCMAFDRYLEAKRQGDRPVFSRTV